MKKVVVFTEGQGELIFTRHILIQMIGYEHLSFECFELNSDRLLPIPYKHNPPNALIHYQIINVGTDERVLSAIAERHEKFVSRGFEIIGLRDMYSTEYKKRSNQIDQGTNELILNASSNLIEGLSNADKIHFFFAIMELESWLLGTYRNLERINIVLTVDNIRNNLDFDLQIIDPETTFFQPAIQLKQVLKLANINYDKHKSDMESIVSTITLGDLNHLVDSNRCSSFASFFSELQREFNESQNS